MHTRSSMRRVLGRSPKTVEKGLYRLWTHQTADERKSGNTRHRNRRGFSLETVDQGTELGGKLARLVAAFLAEGHTEETIPWGCLLATDAEYFVALNICDYHARQLADIANERSKAA